MTHTPALSFVMPARNRGTLISEAIQSLREQTFENWELIVIDDHSDPEDTTETVVTSFNDPRIRYYRLPDEFGKNSPSARNFGNALAQAPIIAVTDSDDIYYPNKAQLIIDAFAEHSCDVFYSNYDKWDEATNTFLERIDNPVIPFDPEVMERYDIIPHGTAAYTKQIALDFPYNSFMRRSADYDLFSRLTTAGKRFYYCPEKTYRHRRHAKSISKTLPRHIVDQYIWQSRGWQPYNPTLAEMIITNEGNK